MPDANSVLEDGGESERFLPSTVNQARDFSVSLSGEVGLPATPQVIIVFHKY